MTRPSSSPSRRRCAQHVTESLVNDEVVSHEGEAAAHEPILTYTIATTIIITLGPLSYNVNRLSLEGRYDKFSHFIIERCWS